MNRYYPHRITYEETKQLVSQIPKTSDYGVGGIRLKLLHDISYLNSKQNRDYADAVKQTALEDFYKELFG